ncbi:MAG TPA: molybdate ABC transporter substrate-binding protein [Stellaceae bacterium]|nr:molybdate ABC transporter substrate-binding protein [Stellaceae bacterium]
MRVSRRFIAASAVAVAMVIANASAAFASDLIIFAAASLKNALDEAVVAYQAEGGEKTAISYAASSALARQIESGAPADLFISADLDWADYLQKRNLLKADTRVDLLSNRLVMIAPAASKLTVEIKPDFPLASLLGDERMAMADPAAVPAGKYGKAALEKLGVWSSVEGKIAPAEDVRAALAFVSRGEAALGIVYATDAAVDKGVKIVAVFPPDSYPRIVYPAAITRDSENPKAAALLAFLQSNQARVIFEKWGFTFLPPGKPS